MKLLVRIVIAGALGFVLLQAVRLSIPTRPASGELQAPPEVRHVFEKNCYSCHSDQRRLAWFDQIVPAYWLVRYDILTAREHLNFSTIGAKPPAAQKAALFEAVNMIQLGAMPLPRFLRLHPQARVTPKELATLKAYLAPWTPAPNQPGQAGSGASAPANETRTPVSLSSIPPEPNGLVFDPTFEHWKPISTTDRGDNSTFRIILGNEIAQKAAQTGNISPWPDGARLAKIAWQQEPGPDGLLHPGNFVQVELMVKDAKRYKKTDGWGWGRWRSLDLKPYGDNARFVDECTTCHLPIRGNDFVYTLPVTRAAAKQEEAVNNSAAALPLGLPYDPSSWNAITMFVNPRDRTTAILYGNDKAINAAQARGPASAPPKYPAGSVLALVTWAQRDDPHWFGARIPGTPQTVEFVEVGAAGERSAYRSFAGPEQTHFVLEDASARNDFILGLVPARLP